MSNSISSFLGVHGDALPLREQRMKLIASNLSNVDTPGYKAKDMDFEAALKSAEGVRDGSLMQTTDAKHYEIGSSGGLNPFQITRESDQPSLDGNTVDPDAERAAYGRAALEYRASLSFLESKVRSMLTAITGQEVMSNLPIFDVAGSALHAQSVRLSTIASNLANADSVAGSAEATYKPIEPIFQAQQSRQDPSLTSVNVKEITTTNAPPIRRYEPGHPLADADGYVFSPDVDPVAQMVNMISASRNYQAGVEMLNTAKELALATIKMGR